MPTVEVTRFLLLSAYDVALSYVAGVRSETIKHHIEVQRQQHATIPALGVDRSDWG